MTALETQLARSSADAHKARELYDIAVSQVTALTAAHASTQEELEAMREQARTAAAQSDDAAIIGKLQRQLMETRSAYQMLTKKLDTMRGSLQKARLAATVLEAAVDEKTAEVRG